MRTDRRRFLQTAAIVTSVAAGAWLFFPQTANAAKGQQSAEVMQLQGTTTAGAGSIDPRVGNVSQLKRPPLSAYNTYTLIGTTSLPAKTGLATSYPLQNGRTLQLTIVEITKDNRYRVLHTILNADGTVYLKQLGMNLAPNEPFFLGGQDFDLKHPDKGGLVLGITIRP